MYFTAEQNCHMHKCVLAAPLKCTPFTRAAALCRPSIIRIVCKLKNMNMRCAGSSWAPYHQHRCHRYPWPVACRDIVRNASAVRNIPTEPKAIASNRRIIKHNVLWIYSKEAHKTVGQVASEREKNNSNWLNWCITFMIFDQQAPEAPKHNQNRNIEPACDTTCVCIEIRQAFCDTPIRSAWKHQKRQVFRFRFSASVRGSCGRYINHRVLCVYVFRTVADKLWNDKEQP